MPAKDRQRRTNLQIMDGSEKENKKQNKIENSNDSRKLSEIRKRTNPFVI